MEACSSWARWTAAQAPASASGAWLWAEERERERERERVSGQRLKEMKGK